MISRSNTRATSKSARASRIFASARRNKRNQGSQLGRQVSDGSSSIVSGPKGSPSREDAES
jgi:hypothetical protein